MILLEKEKGGTKKMRITPSNTQIPKKKKAIQNMCLRHVFHIYTQDTASSFLFNALFLLVVCVQDNPELQKYNVTMRHSLMRGKRDKSKSMLLAIRRCRIFRGHPSIVKADTALADLVQGHPGERKGR
jgi:hypothetical protein